MLLGPVTGSTDPTRGYPSLRFTLDGMGTDVYVIENPEFRLLPSAATVGAVFAPESCSAATHSQTIAAKLRGSGAGAVRRGDGTIRA